MTHFICISGKAGAGKDTTGNMMKEYLELKGYSILITHYAGLLKYICVDYLGWNGIKNGEGRELLQYIGTDCIRKQDPDYWVDFIANLIRMLPKMWDFVIIPDMRFENELTRLSDAGFPSTHVHVERNNFDSSLSEEQKLHSSETALDGVVADYTIPNNGTEEQLLVEAERVCDYILIDIERQSK